MKILVAPSKSRLEEVSTESDIEKLREYGEVIFNNSGTEFTEEDLKNKICDVDVLITSWKSPYISKNILSSAKKLKLICHMGGSIKYQFNIEEIFNRNIKIINGTEVIAKSVAEYTLGTMIMSLRKFQSYHENVKNNGWRWEVNKSWEKSLFSSRVGLIGYGAVSKQLIKLLKPFNSEILVYDPLEKLKVQDDNIRFVEMSELLKSCNVISLHCAFNPDTQNLISKKEMLLIPNNSVIINTAHGSLIEEKYIEEIANEKNISFVLDVFSKEPLPLESPLRNSRNIFCTPHLAGGTIHERKQLLNYMIQQIEMFNNSDTKDFGISAIDISRLA